MRGTDSAFCSSALTLLEERVQCSDKYASVCACYRGMPPCAWMLLRGKRYLPRRLLACHRFRIECGASVSPRGFVRSNSPSTSLIHTHTHRRTHDAHSLSHPLDAYVCVNWEALAGTQWHHCATPTCHWGMTCGAQSAASQSVQQQSVRETFVSSASIHTGVSCTCLASLPAARMALPVAAARGAHFRVHAPAVLSSPLTLHRSISSSLSLSSPADGRARQDRAAGLGHEQLAAACRQSAASGGASSPCSSSRCREQAHCAQESHSVQAHTRAQLGGGCCCCGGLPQLQQLLAALPIHGHIQRTRERQPRQHERVLGPVL